MKSQTLLKVLLVLSMINAVYWFLFGAMMALFLPLLVDFYAAHPELLEDFRVTATWEVVSQVPRPYYAVIALLWALSFTGCLLMWKLRRSGFHCYTLAQLLLIAVPMLFLGKGYGNIVGDIMFAALFIFCYWRLLRTLGAFAAPMVPIETSEDPENSKDSEEAEKTE